MSDLQLAQLPQPRWSRWRALSLAAHAAAFVLVWALHPLPPLLQMHATALGNGPRDLRLVYLGPSGEDALGSSEMLHSRMQLQGRVAPVRKPHRAQADEPRKDAEMADRSARAGSRFGSLFDGPADGRDVRPPYPIVFPDPPIPRWLAQSVAGNVVVEVTIDEQGNVTDYRLLQGVRDDINQKIIATLLTWRFQPAVIDGVRVASREDMHFHFPS